MALAMTKGLCIAILHTSNGNKLCPANPPVFSQNWRWSVHFKTNSILTGEKGGLNGSDECTQTLNYYGGTFGETSSRSTESPRKNRYPPRLGKS